MPEGLNFEWKSKITDFFFYKILFTTETISEVIMTKEVQPKLWIKEPKGRGTCAS